MNTNDLAEKIIKHCKNNNINKLYICGNGASGKTTLSNVIYDKAKKYGNVNLISTDDFIVDTELRNNSNASWNDNGKIKKGRYTSAFKNSYFIKNVEEIIYNLDHGNNHYYFPKKEQIRLLKSEYFLTIIEGIGTAFLNFENDKSLGIFLQCNKENEIKRRIKRAGNSLEQSEEQINSLYEERNSQFKANILTNITKFDIVLESNNNFEINIIKGINL